MTHFQLQMVTNSKAGPNGPGCHGPCPIGHANSHWPAPLGWPGCAQWALSHAQELFSKACSWKLGPVNQSDIYKFHKLCFPLRYPFAQI